MVTLEGFIKEDLNRHTKHVILSTIVKGRQTQKYKDELIFNKYSLEIIFPENRIIIYDDIFTEDEPLSLCLTEFITSVSKDEEE